MMKKSRAALLLQLLIGVAIVVGVGWYIGAQDLGKIFASMDLRYIILSSIAYLAMNLLFVIRLQHVLRALGYRLGFLRLLLVQYGGMLASDVTPARSGYFAVPVMLASEDVLIPVGLSSILGIQSIEFFVKMFGGCLALLYLLSAVKLGRDVFILSVIGVALMLAGGIVLALAMWSRRAGRLITFFRTLPVIGRFFGFLADKVAEFQTESQKVKAVWLEILILTLVSWVVKALEWYFIALALGITQIPFVGYFFLHPLITALSFVPLTPSGIGFQEGAAVGALYLLGVGTSLGLAFALLARVIVTVQDVIGVYALSKTGVKILEAMSTMRKE